MKNFILKFKMLLLTMCFAMSGDIVKAEQITTPEQIYQNNVEKYNSERTDVSALSYYLLDRGAVPPTEYVAEFARELVKDCTDDMEKLQKIHDWVAGNIGYDHYGIHNKTYTIDPYLVFEKRATICEGYSLLTASMCHAVGIPCKVVAGYANGSYQGDGEWTEEIISEVTSGPGHAWNEAYVEGRWVILDTTWDSKVRNTIESEDLLHKNEYVQTYFDPSIEEFSKDHWTLDICDWEMDSRYYGFVPTSASVENGIKISWEKLESNTVYTLQYSKSPFDGYIDYGTTTETSIVFDKAKVLEDTLYFRIYATDSTYYPDLYSEYCKWEKPQYDVVFMDGSNVISRQKVDCWQAATAPDYMKEGYTLEWDRDYQCICSNMTIYAKWTKNVSDVKQDDPLEDPLEDNADKEQENKVTAPAKVKKLKLKNSKGRKAVIQWQKVSSAAGYQVQYSTNKAFKKAKNVYVKNNKYTAKKLKKKKTYYVRVRAYRIQNEKRNCGKWSKIGKIKIKK